MLKIKYYLLSIFVSINLICNESCLQSKNGQSSESSNKMDSSDILVNRANFILITSLYNETNIERLNEYIYCLEKNLKLSEIDHIHIIYDTSKDSTENKILNFLKNKSNISISLVDKRPTFKILFYLANNLFLGKKIIISNADIYFDESLNLLLNFSLKNKFLSLTRWDINSNNNRTSAIFGPYHYGADSWIFQSPIIEFEDTEFELGTWGCDGRIIYQAANSGLKLLNPCKEIICSHVHNSKITHNPIKHTTQAMAWLPVGYLKDNQTDIIILQK